MVAWLKNILGWCGRGCCTICAVPQQRLDSVEVRKSLESELELLRKKASDDWQALDVSAKDLTNVKHTNMKPKISSVTQKHWDAWCPCCKKPIDVVLWQNYPPPSTEHVAEARSLHYAYAAAIWGDGYGLSGFVLGALVLGHSLQKKSSYDRILMHTEEVPVRYLTQLQKLWTLMPVPRIKGNPDLFTCATEGHRFEGVFTKLHALNLLYYDKVLMMDIDLAILDCPDELFELEAPAAMRRGNANNRHGERIHGQSFFGGQWDGWGQTGGINAGVMLLEPNKGDFDQMLLEVCSKRHPERVQGNGPEQDYLSRYYAPKWRHISLKYNFQIHHIFYAMESALKSLSGIKDNWWSDSDNTGNEEEASGEGIIGHGTRLRCMRIPPCSHKVPIFESPYSFHVIGEVAPFDIVDAIGRVIVVKYHNMVPIKVHLLTEDEEQEIEEIGFIDLRQFDIAKDNDDDVKAQLPEAEAPQTTAKEKWIPSYLMPPSDFVLNAVDNVQAERKTSPEATSSYEERASYASAVSHECRNKEYADGMYLICAAIPPSCVQYGLPVFSSGDSWAHVGYIELHSCMIASGPANVAHGWTMIPIRKPYEGFVDGRYVDLLSHKDSTRDLQGYNQVNTCERIDESRANVLQVPSSSDDEMGVWMPERLALNHKDVSIVHCSGVLKMWDRDYLSCETDEEFVNRFLHGNSPYTAKLWLEKGGDVSDYAEFGIHLTEDHFDLLGSQRRHSGDMRRRTAVNTLITQGISSTLNTTLRAAKQWREDLETLPEVLELTSLRALMDVLGRYSCGDTVDVFWTTDNYWYAGVIEDLDSFGNYQIKILDVAHTGKLVWIQREHLRKAGV